MANMRYCRFENTLHALRDCEDTLMYMVDREVEKLSESERESAEELVKACMRIVEMLAQEGQLDLSNADHPNFGDKLAEVVTAVNGEL